MALDFPVKRPAIPVGDENSLVLSSLDCYFASPEKKGIEIKARN